MSGGPPRGDKRSGDYETTSELIERLNVRLFQARG